MKALSALCGGLAALTPAFVVAEKRATFESFVEPFLIDYCFDCHDDASKKGGISLPQDSVNFRITERGRADGDRKHRVVVSGDVPIGAGFRLSGVMTWSRTLNRIESPVSETTWNIAWRSPGSRSCGRTPMNRFTDDNVSVG